jgi:hypothetical protein
MANPSSFTLNTSADALALKMLDMALDGETGWSSPTVSIRLSNTSPSAGDTFSAVETNEISGNGYSTPTATYAAAAYDGGDGRFEKSITGTAPSITASGGTITFQYAYLTVSDADEDYVWGHWSWASAESVSSGETYEFTTLLVNLGAQGATVNS